MSIGKIVLGTLGGLTIGAVAGILFAPEKGSTTRKQIGDKGNEYADDLKSFAKKFKFTKKDVEGLVDIAKAKFDDAKKDVKTIAVNFKHDDEADIKHAKY